MTNTYETRCFLGLSNRNNVHPAEITVKHNSSDPQLHDYIEKLISIMYEAEERYGKITVKTET